MQINFKGPQFVLPLGSDDLSNLTMLVEIPRGSINKYEYKIETGLIHLDRVMFQQTPYPVEYGLIPQTWDEDEDMLDVMCLTSHPTFPGCIINVRPIGVMYFEDGGEIDDKIIAVPTEDVRFKHVHDLNDLSEHTLDEIEFFFTHYKKLQLKYKGKVNPKKAPIVKHWGNREKALKVIAKSAERFKQKWGSNLK